MRVGIKPKISYIALYNRIAIEAGEYTFTFSLITLEEEPVKTIKDCQNYFRYRSQIYIKFDVLVDLIVKEILKI